MSSITKRSIPSLTEANGRFFATGRKLACKNDATLRGAVIHQKLTLPPNPETLHPVDGEIYTNLPKFGHKYLVNLFRRSSYVDVSEILSYCGKS